MPPVRRTSLLDTIRADFAARGWAPDDLGRFRMEGDTPPPPPAPPTPTPPAPTPPQPDLGALQRAIDDAKMTGETTATTSMLTALGFDKLEDAQAWVTAKRDAERAGMDEATRLKAEAEEARKKADTETATANQAKADAARATFGANLTTFLVLCGVPATSITDAGVLVTAELGGDAAAVAAKPEAVIEAAAKVRERQPALFAATPTPPGRAPGSAPGGKPPSGDKPADDYEAGRAAGKAEREASEARRPLLAGMTVLGQHSN